MSYQDVLVDKEGPIATLTMNRAAKRNALCLNLLEEMRHALEDLARQRQVRVIVLAGKGPVFSAGHDLGELMPSSILEYRRIFAACMNMMLLLHQVPQPVIAKVHGVATAAGCQLVAACDLAVASADARFATPGVKIGFFCTTPMVPLSRAIGRKRSLEMLFTGEFISAEQALQFGLLNRVVEPSQLDAAVLELAEQICQFSRTVIAMGKEAFYRQIEMTEQLAYAYASEVIAANGTMPVAREGMAAFLEKRQPVWPE
ncbi:MAG: enoyl-CoA hydratase [Deltaproteobacteria bacterium]|nr:enoyl-CoA hydratase [Deltaproteobacteria bacterium]MBW2070271.1 enoyl-CoA hydratase [Deltaproteobacteria bacterium]